MPETHAVITDLGPKHLPFNWCGSLVLLPRGSGLPAAAALPDAAHEPRHPLAGRPHHCLAQHICPQPAEVRGEPPGVMSLYTG
jgi:hypothetical protein